MMANEPGAAVLVSYETSYVSSLLSCPISPLPARRPEPQVDVGCTATHTGTQHRPWMGLCGGEDNSCTRDPVDAL